MSTRENLSYQGELPAVSYHRNDNPDATAKVSELRLACRRLARRLVRNRQRGIHLDGDAVSTRRRRYPRNRGRADDAR